MSQPTTNLELKPPHNTRKRARASLTESCHLDTPLLGVLKLFLFFLLCGRPPSHCQAPLCCTQLLAEAAVAEILCNASTAARCGSAVLVCCNAMLLVDTVQTSECAPGPSAFAPLRDKRLLPPLRVPWLVGRCRTATSVNKFYLQAHCTAAAVTKRTPCQVC